MEIIQITFLRYGSQEQTQEYIDQISFFLGVKGHVKAGEEEGKVTITYNKLNSKQLQFLQTYGFWDALKTRILLKDASDLDSFNKLASKAQANAHVEGIIEGISIQALQESLS